jgi:methyl-accepting chemotaxis protein
MKQSSMFFKVYGLVAVPTISFTVLAILFLNSNFNNYKSNEIVMEEMPKTRIAVNLISVLQVERGLSASLLSGAKIQEKLNNQRKKVDQNFVIFLSSNITDKTRSELTNFKEIVAEARNKINTKVVTKKEVIQTYSKIVRYLMINISSHVESITESESVQIMINLIQLNETKERAGLLRATIASMLAAKMELTQLQKKKLLMLYGKYKVLLSSSLYKFKDDSRDQYQIILNNPAQVSIDNLVSDLEDSRFDVDPKVGFDIVTDLISEIDKLIFTQIKMVEGNSVKLYSDAKTYIINLLISLIAVLLVILVFTFNVLVKLVKRFRTNLHGLNNKVLSIHLISEQVSKNAKTVSAASNNQARSIQGTSSAIHEIKEILNSSGTILKDAMSKTETCTKVTEQGKIQVSSMLSSIEQISSSNDGLIDQVKANNQNMTKVTNIINEIAQKTTVINAIVFQTKLLSFNASVEAARAGEHGKGFSVVAEEIGQLASMSGTASKEIEDLLNSSMTIVNELSSEMVEKINHFVDLSSKNITEGNKNAYQCSEIFEEIYTTVKEVGRSMEAVNASSSEQKGAVQEIATTIQELDQETNSNLKVVEKNFKNSEGLKDTSVEIREVCDDMCLIVRGKLIQESSNNIIDLSDSNLEI